MIGWLIEEVMKEKRILAFLYLFRHAVSYFEPPGLVVGAVGAGDEFSESPLTGEPSFQIALLRRCQIQLPRHDRHDSMGVGGD